MGSKNSIKQWFGFVIVIVIVIVMVIGMAWARPASAMGYRVSYPQELSNKIFLAPGAVGSFSFDVENLDPTAGTATVKLLDALNGFYLEPVQLGACGPPTSGAQIISIPVALGGGMAQRCMYRLTRATTSTRDGVIGLCAGSRNDSSPCVWDDPDVTRIYAGFNPDIAITTQPTTPALPGDSESVVEVTVRNASSLGTRDIYVYSQCRQYNEQYPYSLDNQILGGCPVVYQQVGCELSGFGIPPPVYRWVVKIAPLTPMGEASCKVRMQFSNPITTSFSDTLSIDGDRFQRFTSIPLELGNNYFGYDPSPENDTKPFGAILPPVVVSVGDRMTWFVLCGVLVAIAWRRRPRMYVTRRSENHLLP